MTTTLLSINLQKTFHAHRIRTLSVLMVLFCAIAGTSSHAQDGSLDLSFDPGTGINAYVEEMIMQPDGKVLICGNFTVYQGQIRRAIARINADGSVDAGFNPGDGPVNTNGEDVVFNMAFQPDGKIIIVGNFQTYGGVAVHKVARLNADGTLDASFNPGAGVDVDKNPFAVAVQPDGKILIGGNFTTFDGVGRNGIARLNADGSLDTSFDPGSGVGSSANAVVGKIYLQPDGKAVIVGDFSAYNGAPANNIVRLNTDGSQDTSFDPGAGPNSDVFALALRSDGKMMVVGNFNEFDGVTQKLIARLNADGSVDTTFGSAITFGGYIMDVVVQPDEKVVVVGSFTGYNGVASKNVMRILADGSSLDPAFSVGAGANTVVTDAWLQPDGKILIAGEFSSYDGVSRSRLARVIGSSASSVMSASTTNAGMVVYPTLVSEQVQVAVLHPAPDSQLEVYNALGILMHVEKKIHQPVVVDVRRYPAGLYFVQLKNGHEIVAVERLIKQ